MTEPAPPAPSKRSHRPLILGGLAVLVLAAAFVGGYVVGHGPVDELTSRATEAETRAAAASSRASLMEALALDYRTVLDLDARNFGTANEHLRRTASVLGDVDTTAVDAARLAALRQRVEGTDINVALDLASQRATVIGFADDLNALMPEPIALPSDSTLSAR